MNMSGAVGVCKCVKLKIVKNVECPEQFSFKPQDFQRFDEKENRQVVFYAFRSSDSVFYEAPRFVTHIDDPAIAALTKYYSKVFSPSNTAGVSHFPPGYKQERIIGMGMNEEELKHNPVLTKYAVQDLNVSPKLPFEDNSFHIITNVVSVDYVTKPLDVFKEMCWILKSFRSPLNEFNLAKISANSFSNRCSWTKPISIWTSTSDADHASLAGAYFHYAGGFEPPQGARLSQTKTHRKSSKDKKLKTNRRFVVFGNWLSPTLLVPAEEFLRLGVLEGATGDEIDADEDHHSHNEDDIDPPPFFPQVSQKSSPAGIAVVAQEVLVIVPYQAVRVSSWVHWVYPQCWIHIVVSTHCWRASIRLSQTSPYFLPSRRVSNIVPQPLGKPFKPILPVSPAGHGVAAVRPRDGEGEDEQDKEQDYEGGHAEKVESQKTLFVEIGANEAGEADEEHEGAEDEDRPSERADALVVRLGGQPDAGRHYWDGAEEGYEVKSCGYPVAHSHGAGQDYSGGGRERVTVGEGIGLDCGMG
ncbi:hypothetical protein ACFX1S_026724 [Malus domestica]